MNIAGVTTLSVTDDFVTSALVERDGQWYCGIGDCAKARDPFPNPKAAKSHPWAAHGIRSRNPESVKRRLRRYRVEPPVVQEEDAAPPPPLQHKRDSVRISEKRGALRDDEVEIVRRRLLYHLHELADEAGAKPVTVLNLYRRIMVKPELPPDYTGPRLYRRSGHDKLSFGGVLRKRVTRDRWLAELVRSQIVRDVHALSRELRRSRGSVIDAVRDCVKARLHRKETAFTSLNEDKAERLMALLEGRPRLIPSMGGEA